MFLLFVIILASYVSVNCATGVSELRCGNGDHRIKRVYKGSVVVKGWQSSSINESIAGFHIAVHF